MTFSIVKADEIKQFKGLVFGPSGNGKTRFVETFNSDPRTAPALFLDREGGTSSIVGSDIDVVHIETELDYEEVLTFLMSDSEENVYQSVILDSISEEHIASLLAQVAGSRKRAIPNLLEQGDYGIALVMMRRLIRGLRDSGKHFIATALTKGDIDPQIGNFVKPALVGALADEAPGMFDAVMYLGVSRSARPVSDEEDAELIEVVERVLVLQNYPEYRTKVRVPIGVTIPDEIVLPDTSLETDVTPAATLLLDALHF